MKRPVRFVVVVGWAALIAGWLVLDTVRQNQLGVADAGLWFVVSGAAVAVAAAVATARWPERRRVGLLILWWLTTAVGSDVGAAWPTSRVATTALLVATALQAPAYAHMTLAYPSGYVRNRLERAFLVLAYVVSLLWQLPPALFADPRGCSGCAPGAPSLLFTGHSFDYTPIGRVFWVVFIALGVAFMGLLARRLRQSPPGALRTLFPLVAAGFFAGAQFLVLRIAWLIDWQQPLGTLNWMGRAGLVAVPVAIAIGVATIRRHRGPLGDLMVELGTARPGEIQAALSRTVGDASLELALWLPDQKQYVNEDGATVRIDQSAPGRAVTLIGSAQQPLAALIHDTNLVGQRSLLEAAGTAARIALENARLHAELQAQLGTLRASRARIVAAGDAERRRVERDLHDGAQQRLLALGLALQLLRDDGADAQLLAEAEDELQAALRELRQLARGIHPAILTDQGLRPAISSLVDRAAIPIDAQICDGRYPEAVESAAYFVVSEALANIAKHAAAQAASVTVRQHNGRLVIEVSDDGCGGAEPAAGSGLQGLIDRVGALDGTLSIRTGNRAGTTIHAELPCGSS